MLSQENVQLLDSLTQDKKLSEDYKNVLLIEHEHSACPIDELLLKMGILNEDELLNLTSKLRECPAVSLQNYKKDIFALCHLFPYKILADCFAVPISYQEDTRILTIAMADTGDICAYDKLKKCLPCQDHLVTVMAKKSEILFVLQEITPKPNVQSAIHYTINDQVINQFLHSLIVDAVTCHSSDIHFEPEKFFVRVRYRRDGLLQTGCSFHESFWQPLCIQLKILSCMDIAETRRPQDGRFSLSVMGRSVDFRVSSHPTIHGENIVLRILDKEKSLISLQDLGYSLHNLKNIQRILQKPEGLIIITGPTGSGKTTSLYSMLSELNTDQLNIMTLEEPVEYYMPYIRQSEVRENSSFDFATGIHSILRQDPDVILIGEIRDEQTADMAIRAGMTGHIVLTTLHTVHALATIYRLMELKVPLSLLAGVLSGIVAQRLVRLLCMQCKQEITLSAQQAQQYRVWPQVNVYKAVGCRFCTQGYQGRKAIAETIVMDSDLESLILDQSSHRDIKLYLHQKGFKSLLMDGLSCVLSGETSLEEMWRVVGI